MQQDVTVDDERHKTVSVIRRSLVRSRTTAAPGWQFPDSPASLDLPRLLPISSLNHADPKNIRTQDTECGSTGEDMTFNKRGQTQSIDLGTIASSREYRPLSKYHRYSTSCTDGNFSNVILRRDSTDLATQLRTGFAFSRSQQCCPSNMSEGDSTFSLAQLNHDDILRIASGDHLH